MYRTIFIIFANCINKKLYGDRMSNYLGNLQITTENINNLKD
jgi:hypothetical protein